ncbi:MAG: hypothetical protein LUG18_08550 [Candidatus Azobacteroides sp.]|nr:hypothetical protein [Candidatus Azobacteroides sp.]
MFDINDISDELLAAYLDGNTTPEETNKIREAISSDEEVAEIITISTDMENNTSIKEDILLSLTEENPEELNIFSNIPDNFNDFLDSDIKNNIDMERQIKYANGHIGENVKIDVSSDVFQWYEDTCAIKSQQLVLEKYGVFVSQEELIEVATRNGWYIPQGGTPMNCVGNLLDYYGVPSTSVIGANVNNIVAELAQGHQVIVGLDAGELHNNRILETLKDLFIGPTPNHALIVAGIDTTDPENEFVILKDPGTGDVAKPYPLSKFLYAWKDADCLMVTTHDPAYPQYAPELINFDYQEMHIGTIGEMTFDDFITDNQIIMPDEMFVIDSLVVDQWMQDSLDSNMDDLSFQEVEE